MKPRIRASILQWIITLIPLVLWYFIFQISPAIPHNHRPEIYTIKFWKLDHFFFGHASELWIGHTHIVLDILAAVFYSLHMLIPVAGICWLVFKYRTHEIRSFIFVFGLVSLFSVCTHILFPAAPPWFVDQQCFKDDIECFASYNSTGNAAGLTRVDHHFEVNFFQASYRSLPVVFGTFPSLHVAWPCILFVFTQTRLEIILSMIHVIGLSWSSVYLRHHYVMDAVGAFFYVFIVWFSVKTVREAIGIYLKPDSGRVTEYNWRELDV